MPRTRPFVIALLAAGSLTAPLRAQADHGTIVVVTGQYPGLPIPTLIQGSSNQDVADLLFLRLARLGPTLSSDGDAGFVPQLAAHWTRRDSVTLAFDLDPRARWHDGVPVTAADVLFSFKRSQDPAINPSLATLLHPITSVTAEGDHRVVFRFDHRYPSQFYDATYQVQILPAHLLAALAPAAVASAPFTQAPIGDGPFKWVRGVAGQFVELAANRDYFLGAPKLDRVIFRASGDGETRMTLLLSGEGDALENILPVTNQDRVRADSDLKLLAVPSFMVGYFLYNQRDPADHAKPHPLFADLAVRRALTLALDRETMARSVFGPAAQVPIGPASLSLWVHLPEPAARQDTAAARAMLRAAGWIDRNGDGILEKDGRPLAFTIIFPAVSAARRQIALQAQASWKAIGADVTLESLDFPTYLDRRRNNRFDVDVSAVIQDPSPTGLVQSWTCASMGGANVASYCDPAVDSLIAAATLSGNSLPLWQQVLRAIDADAPGAFIFAPTAMIAVHRRFRGVVLHPESFWSGLGDWSVAPGQQLPRDRGADR